MLEKVNPSHPDKAADITAEANGGCWTVDEKIGQTYVWHEQANTLASRDFKQPQAVVMIMEKVNNAESNRNIEPRSASGKL